MMYRSMIYGFPEAVLAPGEERSVRIDCGKWFRPEKLAVHGRMDVVRGHYRVKRSRLPPLNRDDVVSYTRIYRCRRGRRIWFRRGRTTIEYRGADKSFVRTYLPESVEYVHVDPLSYVQLLNVYCGTDAAMPHTAEGVSALFFGFDRIGNGMCLPRLSSSPAVSLKFKNVGDVEVGVSASIMGVGE